VPIAKAPTIMESGLARPKSRISSGGTPKIPLPMIPFKTSPVIANRPIERGRVKKCPCDNRGQSLADWWLVKTDGSLSLPDGHGFQFQAAGTVWPGNEVLDLIVPFMAIHGYFTAISRPVVALAHRAMLGGRE